MGTNCAPLVAGLFLYCYERDHMDSLNHDNQADVIDAFNSTTRYLDDPLYIDNPYFEGMVNQTTVEESQHQRYRSPLLRFIYIFLLQMDLSLLKFLINEFDFDNVFFFRFWMVTFLALLFMLYTNHNLLGSLESAIMLRTSTREINVRKPFLDFIADTLNCFLNLMLG